MNHCLDAMEARLTDLLQTGLDTGGTDAGRAFARLAGLLDARAHALEKEDGPLLDALFTAERYIALCRERLQETEIQRAWQRDCSQQTEGGTHL